MCLIWMFWHDTASSAAAQAIVKNDDLCLRLEPYWVKKLSELNVGKKNYQSEVKKVERQLTTCACADCHLHPGTAEVARRECGARQTVPSRENGIDDNGRRSDYDDATRLKIGVSTIIEEWR